MKNNILTHKIIPILAIFILCFFSICVSNVEAAELSEYNTLPSEVSTTIHLLSEYSNSDYQVFAFYCSTRSNYRCIFVDSTIYPDITVSFRSNHIQLNGTSFIYYDISASGYIESGPTQTEFISNYGETLGNHNFLFKNISVYNEDTGETFFTPPPTVTELLVEETARTQIMEQMKKTIVGFLKYLIVLVVSLLAFWKGWKFLSTQLKKA